MANIFVRNSSDSTSICKLVPGETAMCIYDKMNTSKWQAYKTTVN